MEFTSAYFGSSTPYFCQSVNVALSIAMVKLLDYRAIAWILRNISRIGRLVPSYNCVGSWSGRWLVVVGSPRVLRGPSSLWFMPLMPRSTLQSASSTLRTLPHSPAYRITGDGQDTMPLAEEMSYYRW